MEKNHSRRLDAPLFDERSESWYIDTREMEALLLERDSLEGLVQLYNSVHTGNPLVLIDRKGVVRLEERNRRLAETVRDLYMRIDEAQRRRPVSILRSAILAFARPRRPRS